MSKKKPAEFSLRRITLQIFLQSCSRVSIDQIAQLPVYQRLNLARRDLIDRIHEDLKILRDSGVDVVTQMRDGINYYFIDVSDEIPLQLAAGFDATLLRTILLHHSDLEQVLYAKAGVNKLLAEAHPEDSRKKANAQIVANLPKGAYIPQIAQAIVKGRGIEFIYYSLSSQQCRSYRVLPQALVPHFESFYLQAYCVQSLSKTELLLEEQPRTFRTSRILTTPKEFAVPKNFSLPQLQNDFLGEKTQHNTTQTTPAQSLTANTANANLVSTKSDYRQQHYFAKVTPIVWIKPGHATPLRNLATPISAVADFHIDTSPVGESAAGEATTDVFQLAQMYREDLFELLNFYGKDVRLLAPVELRDAWIARLKAFSTKHFSPPFTPNFHDLQSLQNLQSLQKSGEREDKSWI